MNRSRPLLSTMLKRSRYLLTAILGTAFADASVMAADPVPVVPVVPVQAVPVVPVQAAPVQSVETVNFLRRATPYGARQYTPAPCPPQQGVPVVPYNPNDPNAPKVDPNAQQPVAPVAPDNSMARADQGGTAAIHTNAPNLFGDLFGAKASVITQTTNGSQIVTTTRTGTLSAPANPLPGQPLVVGGNLGSGVTLGIPNIGLNAPVNVPGGAGIQFAQSIAPGAPVNLVNVQGISTALTPLLQPGGAIYNGAQTALQAVNPQATLQSLVIPTPTAANTSFAFTPGAPNGTLAYGVPITSTTSIPTTNTVVVGLPTPGAGGVVGLLKISEDNSPFPRDRVIFTYDYFDNTQINAGGANTNGIPVNRYQFGFEKTLFQGRASFEVRVPFASTQSSSANFGQDSLATEFGNIRLTGKALLRRGDVVNISGGLGVSLPTADDISLSVAGRGEVVHVNNRSVQLSPFLAMQLTPNERLFAQAWYGFLFDTGGNATTIDAGFFAPIMGAANLVKIGNLKSASLQTIDGQIGYWVYKSDQGFLRGVAPFVELHYTGDTGKGTLFRTGNLVIGDVTNYEEFNLTAGVTTRIAQNTTLAVAAAAPLLGQNGRTFDYQIGVRLNWYFGYTARQRQGGAPSALAPNSF